ncbi:MAG: hypothetical protein IPJ41_00290 [Phycisphaerales bacterium]|nr:hypothetical protein [Phycisphaerales bacterium]
MSKLSVCLIAVGLLALDAAAQPIRVLTLDESRTTVCGSIDFNVLTGNAFAEVRAALDNPANFGSGGTVPRDLEWRPQAPRITREALQGCDIVLLSSEEPLDVCERRALLEFVQAGGGLFSFENNAARTMGRPLGAIPTLSNLSGDGAITDASNPVADGPFGAVSGSLIMSYHLGFVDVGPDGHAFATSSGDYAATFEVGAGRAVLYCDEESFMTIFQSGCAVGQLSAKERALFLNAVAYVAPVGGFQFTGEGACCPADANGDGQVNTIDVLTFLNQWTTEDAFADINGDGAINTQDVLAFLNLWNAGC